MYKFFNMISRVNIDVFTIILKKWRDNISSFFLQDVSRILIIFFLYFLLLTNYDIYALDPHKELTQYSLRVWNQNLGLPQNTVHDIIQTYDKYIWVATYEGLARFDGVNFTVFDSRNTSAIRVNGIWSLMESRDSTLWIGTNGSGIVCYKNNQWVPITAEKDGLSNNIVLKILEDSRGYVWAGTRDGLNLIKPDTIIRYGIENGLTDPQVNTLMEDRQGRLWIGTSRGVAIWDNGSITHFTIPSVLGSDLILSFAQLSDQSIWIGTEKKLIHWDSTGYRLYTEKNGLRDMNIAALYEDSHQQLWVSTHRGLHRLDTTNFQVLSQEEGLMDDVVNPLCEDHEGNLWIGSLRGGLGCLSDGKFWIYDHNQGFQSDIVNSLLHDKNGGLWLGLGNHGLSYYFQGGIKRYSDLEIFQNDYIRSLYVDHKDWLWAGTFSHGIICLNKDRYRFYNSSCGLPNDNIKSITERVPGEYWVATRNGLCRIVEDSIRIFLREDGLPVNSILKVFTTRNQCLWIGTDGGGALCYDKNKFKCFSVADGLSSDIVFSFYEDPEGRLWIGTNNGLNYFYKGNIVPITVRSGLYSNQIFSITMDTLYENFWFSCSKGIFTIPRSMLMDFVMGIRQQISSRFFNKLDGMKSEECIGAMDPVVSQSSDGRLWYATTQGIAVIDPLNIPINHTPPIVYIAEIRVQDQVLPLSDTVILQLMEKELQISYSALSYSVPEGVRCSFRLKGFNEDWQHVQQRRIAYYTNLPPGTYLFQVMAENYDGIASPEPAQLLLIVKPPFWRTYWAYIIYSIFLIFIVLLIFYYQLEHEKKRVLRGRHLQEMKLARELQLSMLPSEIPLFHHHALFPYMESASEVAGDYYDFFVLNDQRLVLVVGDVTGHGLASGFVTAQAKSLLWSLMSLLDKVNPTFVLQHINQVFIKTHHKYAICMTIAIYDFSIHELKIANSGLPYPYLYRSQSDTVSSLEIGGVPLGFLEEWKYEMESIYLEPGDFILFCTDGMPEMTNDSREQFGYGRLYNFIVKHRHKDPQDILIALRNELSEFTSAQPRDDITLLVFKRFQ